jgi:hypothetical protein
VTPADALRDGGLRAFHASPAARRLARGSPVDAAEQPLVSIICRTMGRPEFADAVASVAVQTYPNVEFVVVDAAARGLVLEPWCGRFPQRVVGSGQPLARAAACNVGLDAARGEYCLFLDEDDWIDPGHVAKLAFALQTRRDCPAAYTGVAVADHGGKPVGQTFDHDFDLFRLLTANSMPIHAVLFSRAHVLAGCRFDESLDVFEDWDFWLQLARSGDFLRVPGLSAYYRQDGESGFGVLSTPKDAEQRLRTRAACIDVLKRQLRRASTAELWSLLARARSQSDERLAATEAANATLTQFRDGAAAREAELLEILRVKEAELQGAHAELAHVFDSRAWRFSAPYRWLVRQLNRVGVGIRRDVGEPGAANRKKL